MPHKHKRKVRDEDVSNYNLPPNTLARPLPVTKTSRAAINKSKANAKNSGTSRVRKSRQGTTDDTPKAFLRLMRFQSSAKRPSGLDEGEVAPKKRIKAPAKSLQEERKARPAEELSLLEPKSKAGTEEALKIQPGERLSEFSARVNQALPISGLNRKAKQLKKAGLGDLVRERQTKREKKIQRMQAEWREQDAKIKEREEEAREEAEDEEAELWSNLGKAGPEEVEGVRLSKKQRRGMANRIDDPWAELKSRREQRRGLHDVAQAPPELKEPKQKLKLKNGAEIDVANVPSSAGSLRRREELSTARMDVIERYRKMMQERKDQRV